MILEVREASRGLSPLLAPKTRAAGHYSQGFLRTQAKSREKRWKNAYFLRLASKTPQKCGFSTCRRRTHMLAAFFPQQLHAGQMFALGGGVSQLPGNSTRRS